MDTLKYITCYGRLRLIQAGRTSWGGKKEKCTFFKFCRVLFLYHEDEIEKSDRFIGAIPMCWSL